MKVARWEKHGDVWAAIDPFGWKRAVILLESGPEYRVFYGYAPLGSSDPIREFRCESLPKLKREIQRALAGV